MLQALVELVGAILHGVGSTPGRGDAPRATPGAQRANVVIAIVATVVLAACLGGVVVGVLLAIANA